jgi:hypothetical protein
VVSSNSDDAEEAKDEDLAATEWVSNGAVRKGRGGPARGRVYALVEAGTN